MLPTWGANMSASYEIWLSWNDGIRMALLDVVTEFSYSIVMHNIGVCTLELPSTFDRTSLHHDMRIEVWRRPEDGTLALERVYLIRRLIDVMDKNGVRSVKIVGLDGNSLLKRRIINFNEGNGECTGEWNADAWAWWLVHTNLGAAAYDVDRRMPADFYETDTYEEFGPLVTISFARRNLLAACQELAEMAESTGEPIYWHMIDFSPTKWQFRTYVGQPGVDHSYPNGVGVVMLSPELGNLSEPTLDENLTDEVNMVIAGGKGEGEDRMVDYAYDTERLNRSPYGLCEGFVNATSGEETWNDIYAAALSSLAKGYPKLTMTANLVDTEGTRYGVHWKWGDRVTMSYAGRVVDAIVRAVTVTVKANGKESIQAKLEAA